MGIAVPVVQNDSGNEDIQVEERSGESSVHMYPIQYYKGDWYHFNDVECVGRGHHRVAHRNEVLKFRTDHESDIDLSPSWTPVQPELTWMLIGTHGAIDYGFTEQIDPRYADGYTIISGIRDEYRKELYCYGGTPVEYTYDDGSGKAVFIAIFGFLIISSYCTGFWFVSRSKIQRGQN